MNPKLVTFNVGHLDSTLEQNLGNWERTLGLLQSKGLTSMVDGGVDFEFKVIVTNMTQLDFIEALCIHFRQDYYDIRDTVTGERRRCYVGGYTGTGPNGTPLRVGLVSVRLDN